jgi:hypothetical protein
MSIKILFGFPIYVGKINPKNYNKKEITNIIQKNYNINENRNKWDAQSNLHHLNKDLDNDEFLTINFDSLLPEYKKVIEDYFNHINFKQKIDYKFEIVNYTCMKNNQFMKAHIHSDSHFSMVHYIKFNKKIHKSTCFENPNAHSLYMDQIYPDFLKKIDNNEIINSYFFKTFHLNIEEDDVCIFSGLLPHSVFKHEKINEIRMTIVTNIKILNNDKTN